MKREADLNHNRCKAFTIGSSSTLAVPRFWHDADLPSQRVEGDGIFSIFILAFWCCLSKEREKKRKKKKKKKKTLSQAVILLSRQIQVQDNYIREISEKTHD